MSSSVSCVCIFRKPPTVLICTCLREQVGTDVLHAVAITLVPEDRRGLVDAQLERFTGAVRLDPRNDFAEEIRLRIQLEPDTTARMSMVADADTLWRDEIVEKLESLGARPR